ncbi:hypothetical protein NP493_1175g00013 [Ridgeia piscesae]|uniref:Uncharacterized protein n=1 Tax=Ridgeia piscesae TaxID=27915 RepID=A0AAD9KED7_RIDPI|nr:hypothetical protein NP493_1175g00013 [Ridgeia piscesae]
MSDLEKERRKRTDTLSSGGLVTKTLKRLSAANDDSDAMACSEKGVKFEVEIDNKQFTAPNNIYIPNPVYRSSIDSSSSSNDDFVELPITFAGHTAGQYGCNIILRSKNDVRIFHIECTVVPEGSETQIEFTSPVHQPLTQELPIVNQSSHDWPMQVAIDGTGFSGPDLFTAKAFQTTNYQIMFRPQHEGLVKVNQSSHDWPMQVAIDGTGFSGPDLFTAKAFQTTNYQIMFRPQHEGLVKGRIILTNTLDGIDHTFHLVGKGEKPLPLDSVVFDCRVKETVKRRLQIPNNMKRKLFFEVECDIECLSGPDSLLVLAGQTGIYEVSVTPLRRGTYNGVLAFVARQGPKTMVDSDDDVVVTAWLTVMMMLLSQQVDSDDDVVVTAWLTVMMMLLSQQVDSDDDVVVTAWLTVIMVDSDDDVVVTAWLTVMMMLLSQQVDSDVMLLSQQVDSDGDVVVTACTVDSDGDEMPDEDEEEQSSQEYRIWFAVEINVEPQPPERTVYITSPCQKKVALELNINNPTNKVLSLEAVIDGPSLTGPNYIHILPSSKGTYELTYAPAIIGSYKGSLILYNAMVGEFWYDLHLEATSPLPVTLPVMECELGRYVEQPLTLTNPTDESLTFVPTVSNTNNFSLERTMKGDTFTLAPRQSVTFTVKFMPSALGESDHNCRISFHSEQLGEWVFLASGVGRLPEEQDAVSVTAPAATNSTLIIPFRNPTDTTIKVNVKLTTLLALPTTPSLVVTGKNLDVYVSFVEHSRSRVELRTLD